MPGFKKSTNVICVIGAVCRFEALCWEWHYNKARCNITDVNIRSCNAPSYRKQEYIQRGKSWTVILHPHLLYKATVILKDTCLVSALSLRLYFHCSFDLSHLLTAGRKQTSVQYLHKCTTPTMWQISTCDKRLANTPHIKTIVTLFM